FPNDVEGINKSITENMPFTELVFDSLKGKFFDDNTVITAFENMLNTEEQKLIPKLLVLRGNIDGFSKKQHRDVIGYVKQNNAVTDTVLVDRDGKFFNE